MVDWTLARRVAAIAGATEGSTEVGVDLIAASKRLEPEVAGYTGLDPQGHAPPAEVVDRAGWADANLTTFSDLLTPIADRMSERLGRAGPIAGPLRMGAGATIATEAGLITGYMSQRVLGQFELSLIQPEGPTRLLFVSPNLRKAVDELEVDRDAFYDWIVLHELTHVVQFTGVPWLRDHLGGLLRAYLDTVDVRIQAGPAGGLPSMPNMQALVERFRDGGLMALIQTHEQRELMDKLQPVMAVIEGYSEHVMDALGATLVPGYEKLREAMDRRRRSRSAPERLLQKLLGLDLKMRQYEQGKRFCDAVAAEVGIGGLNVVWRSPEDMPTAAELDDPAAWIRRTSLPSAA
ncbi:MAG TPA: zinc-dependent metalloprotease [Thermoleophilaceae bacterium]|nr:zinc-dependent metalloprotease [Thermoleophilaceae bacterium]